jgi:hypothetical protein
MTRRLFCVVTRNELPIISRVAFSTISVAPPVALSIIGVMPTLSAPFFTPEENVSLQGLLVRAKNDDQYQLSFSIDCWISGL